MSKVYVIDNDQPNTVAAIPSMRRLPIPTGCRVN
jgi:hypothetical protein